MAAPARTSTGAIVRPGTPYHAGGGSLSNHLAVRPRSLASRVAAARRSSSSGARTGVLSFVVGLAVIVAACSGAPAVKAYKATAYTVHAVKTAMLVFNDEYQAGRFTEQDRLNVIEVYEKYRAGMKVAIKAQKVALDAQGVPLDNVVLQGEMQSLAADVIAFLDGLRKGKAP